ncbi:DNA helicase UvrD [Candidatus Uhrbacteria bacterium]|nr:DNA helicase UvrD [Candidatus Uhrbacteria bacterium]
MRYITDFHIHSKYSRACSKYLELESIAAWAQIKGINVVSCGDFTHPRWFADIEKKLIETTPGLFSLRPEYVREISNIQNKAGISHITSPLPLFILTTEISCIYSKGGKVRRVHLLIFAPSLDAVRAINAKLSTLGKLASDGRPILGLDAKELLKIITDISPECFIVPAHIWTPWFALFGSKSGFNSIEECFEELSPLIFAAETGLSSDPLMNWSISNLNSITLISNSDAHSAEKLGREANVFEGMEISYPAIREALQKGKQGTPSLRLDYTIEFFPEEGRYHFDGHRDCEISLPPGQTKRYKGMCPKCSRPLTVGVLHRVSDLADQDAHAQREKKISYKNLIPLQEIIAQSFGLGVNSKRVREQYIKVINSFGSEFEILLDTPLEDFSRVASRELTHALATMRAGEVEIIPGYDGVYGVINAVKIKIKKQQALL